MGFLPYLLAFFSIASGLSSVTVLTPLVLSKYLSSKPFTVVAGYVALCDFLKSIVYAIRFLNLEDDNACKVQAAIGLTVNLSALFWIIRFTHFLYQIIVRRARKIYISWIDHCICWGIPLVVTFGPTMSGWTTFGNGAEWNKEREAFFPLPKKVALDVLNMACSWQPTTRTPPWMFDEANNPFVIYALIFYTCIFIILIEMAIVIVTLSCFVDAADMRLSVTKYLLYSFAFMISQGIFNLVVILAINELVPWSATIYLFGLNFLTGLFYAISFWLVDDIARLWLRDTLEFLHFRFQAGEVFRFQTRDEDFDDDDLTFRVNTFPENQDSEIQLQYRSDIVVSTDSSQF